MSASDDNRLTTTGQVDWTSLSRSTITMSLDVAARFANAGVDAITVGVGRALGSRFLFPPEGQQELMSSLNQMKGVSSFSNTIWFGFGVKHVVRALIETEQGAMFVALCAALADGRSKLWDVGCVLREMCLVLDAPPELIPSIHQWKTFAGVCEGSLRRSHFPDVYHHFFRLFVPQGHSSPLSGPAMAKALHALGKLSKKETVNVVFAGTGECALLAAIAQCLLRLLVQIQDEDGVTLYASQDSLSPRALFIRKTLGSQAPGNWHHGPANEIVQKTYYEVIPSELLLLEDFYGPTTWSSVLSDTFGQTWKAFRKPHLAQALHDLLHFDGTSSLSEYASDCPINNMLLHQMSDPIRQCECSSQGHRTENIAYAWLPELKVLAHLSNGKTCTSREACLQTIETECTAHSGFAEPLISGDMSMPAGCLAKTATCITMLTWALRTIGNVNPAVTPSVRGLQGLNSYLEDTPFAFHPKITNGFEFMKFLLFLFTGERDPVRFTALLSAKLSGELSAVSSRGICIIYPILRNLSLPVLDAVSPEVFPGHIMSRGRKYTRVADTTGGQSQDLDLTDLKYPAAIKLQLIASENQEPSVLEVRFRGTSPLGREMHFSPAETAFRCMELFCFANLPHTGDGESQVTSCSDVMRRLSLSIEVDGRLMMGGNCGSDQSQAQMYLVVGEKSRVNVLEFSTPAAQFVLGHCFNHSKRFLKYCVWTVLKVSNPSPCCFITALLEVEQRRRSASLWSWTRGPESLPPRGKVVITVVFSTLARDGNLRSIEAIVTTTPQT